MPTKYSKKACDKCGKPFVPASGRQKYCKRKACVAARKRGPVGGKKKRKNGLGRKKCENCGDMFDKKKKGQRFCCPDCVKAYDHGGGRPKSELTEDQLSKLKNAFLMDCSIGEACLYAEITYYAYNTHVKAHPEFAKEVSLWRNNPYLRARSSIMRGIESDPKLALAYMERKKRDEFSLKSETTFTNPDGTPIDQSINVVFVKPGEVQPEDDEEDKD